LALSSEGFGSFLVLFTSMQGFFQQFCWPFLVGIPYVPFYPGQSRFVGFVLASRSVNQKVPVKHTVIHHE